MFISRQFMDFIERAVFALAAVDRELSTPRDTALRVLRAVATSPGAATAQVATAAGLSSSGCVRALDRLAAGGHVSRFDAADHRSTLIELTDSGALLLESVDAGRRSAATAVISSTPRWLAVELLHCAQRAQPAPPGSQ